jgi:dTDP-4-dehydrorhamnose reductase
VKLLLLGSDGQVGWELQRSLAPLGNLVALRRRDRGGDLGELTVVVDTVRQLRPDVIVNAAAYTSVDKAESERETAFAINASAPESLARAALAQGALLVHFSTDYVFDGSGAAPWRETSPTGPLNVYGESKLAGEEAIRASGCRHLLIRTSWVYGARGQNFARTMLRLAQDRETLTVIDDQHGAPTGAELLADAVAHAIRSSDAHSTRTGTYHVAAAGETSWHGYAQHVIAAAREAGIPVRVTSEGVRPVPSSAYVTPAKRPLNSRLDSSKFETTFGLRMPDWRRGVDRMLAEVMGR